MNAKVKSVEVTCRKKRRDLRLKTARAIKTNPLYMNKMYSFINEKWQKCYSYNIIYIFCVIYGWITVKTAFIQKPPITRWNLEKYNVSGTKVLSLLLVLTLDIWVFSILLFINFVFACKRTKKQKNRRRTKWPRNNGV